MVNSRRKGSQSERDVFRIFSAWWGDRFCRRSLGQKGSDGHTPADFPFSVEVKNHKTVKVRHLFNPTKDILDFWRQTLEQAEEEKKLPLLVIKIEGKWFCVLRQALPAGICMVTKFGDMQVMALPLEVAIEIDKSYWLNCQARN